MKSLSDIDLSTAEIDSIHLPYSFPAVPGKPPLQPCVYRLSFFRQAAS